MCVSKSRLTVYFEPPFWVGLYQREDEEGFQACRVVFGGEPRDQIGRASCRERVWLKV